MSRESLTQRIVFLGKFLRHGTRIASVTPSSRWLARATIDPIDWEHANTVLELGAGMGAITEEILRVLGPGACFVTIESDETFCEILRGKFGSRDGVHVICGDATDFVPLLEMLGIKSVDAIISGLPTPSLGSAGINRLMYSVRKTLKEDGYFCQITEMPFVFLRFYKKYFSQVQFKIELRNIPPGGAYWCRIPKRQQ